MIQVLEYSKSFYKNFKELLENKKKIKLIKVFDSINIVVIQINLILKVFMEICYVEI